MKKYFIGFMVFVLFTLSLQTVTFAENLENVGEFPYYLGFHKAIAVDDIDTIKYGVFVNNTTNVCADIQYEDLRKWLEIYWNFSYERVIAPLQAYSLNEEYIKLWNEDKSKSYIVYQNAAVIVGKYGEPYELGGEIKQNYVWFFPCIGNGRNALYTATSKLRYTYITPPPDYYKDIEYKEEYQRTLTPDDDIVIPDNNMLVTDGASLWAIPEIEKAAAYNLMIYNLSDKYTKPITRYEFCNLLFRLIATEFGPNSDSRSGRWSIVSQIMEDKGICNHVKFSDCDYTEIEYLASMGIVAGMGDGTFAPDELITREQAAILLIKAAEFLGNKTIPKPYFTQEFNDDSAISEWAKSSVYIIKATGIMQGVSETSFAPSDNYTVEQAIATMLRLYCYNLA